MITPAERASLLERAYIPEHLPDYVLSISPGEAFLLGEYLCYRSGSSLTLVGYPLDEQFSAHRLERAVSDAMERFEPGVLSLLAPSIPASLDTPETSQPDCYYRLDLASLTPGKKVRNLLHRAERVLQVVEGRWMGREHRRLVGEFLSTNEVDDGTRSIFEMLPRYVSNARTAYMYEARDERGRLVAFDVADFAASRYAFYMFNFRSSRFYTPGASDLLLWHIAQDAIRRGQRYLNLGLGINRGVAFFKEKWGGEPFLEHHTCLRRYAASNPWLDLLDAF